MIERWQDDPERASRIEGLLAEVRRRRVMLQDAVTAAADPATPRHDHYTRNLAAPGAQRGLDAAVMVAFSDRTPPPDLDLMRAAGITSDELQRLRDRYNRHPDD